MVMMWIFEFNILIEDYEGGDNDKDNDNDDDDGDDGDDDGTSLFCIQLV